MPATVMRDDSISVLREKQHLAVPRIRVQGPSMGERDHWALTPFLVIDCCAVTSRDRRHCYPPSLSSFCVLNNRRLFIVRVASAPSPIMGASGQDTPRVTALAR